MHRGSQAVKFVRDYLTENPVLDEPRLRSNYILLSFGAELILKSRVVILSHASDKDRFEKELQGISHDFTKIARILGKKELHNIGIENIELKIARCNDPINPKDEYSYFVIKTATDEVVIENFTDIRYGCMGGGMRFVNENEHEKIVRYAKLVLEMGEKIVSANSTSQL